MFARLLTAFSILALLLFTACPESARAENFGENKSTLNRIIQGKLLRVGVVPIAPLVMLTKENKLIGLEVDVAQRLANDLGVSLKLVPVRSTELINGLIGDRYDMIICGYSITPSRALRVDFTVPYYYTGIHLVASKQAAPGKTLAYFNSPGATLGIVDGYSEIRSIEKNFPQASLRVFDGEDTLLKALLEGEIPAAVVSDQHILFNVAFHANKLYLPDDKSLSTDPIAIAIRKNDAETLNFLNSWIQILDSEGWVKERKAFWYEQSSWLKDVQIELN